MHGFYALGSIQVDSVHGIAYEETTIGFTYVLNLSEDSNHKEITRDFWFIATEYYVPQGNEVRESAETFLEGEDELFSDSDTDDVDTDSNSRHGSRQPTRQPKPREKPIRLLTEFTIFDSRHRNEYVVLSKIEEEDGVDRRFEVVGWVVPFYEDEDDLLGEDGDEGGGDEEIEPVLMRVGPVLRYSVDWTKDKEYVFLHSILASTDVILAFSPIYIETQHAWYILKMPAEKYTRWYQAFYTPRRVAQLIISNAIKRLHMGFDAFVHGILAASMDIVGTRFEEDDLWNAV